MSRFYEPDLTVNPDSPFVRDASNKLVRRSYWTDMTDKTLVTVMTQGIGANLTNDEKRAHLIDLNAVGLQRLLSRKIAQPRVARFFPLLGEFDRGGKPSIARVLASSCQNSPHAVSRSFT